MSQKTESYSIGDTAVMTGLAPGRLRNWERAGIIPPPSRAVCGDRAYRRYYPEDVDRIKAIKSLLEQGFTLTHASKVANGSDASVQDGQGLCG